MDHAPQARRLSCSTPSLQPVLLGLIGACAALACSSSDGGSTGGGGGGSSNGTAGSHATAGASGGVSSNGGASGNGGSTANGGSSGSTAGGASGGSTPQGGAAGTGGSAGGMAGTAGAGGACSTNVGYGDAWIAPANHPSNTDTVSSEVTWDGSCAASGSNSTATLSNGWKPIFNGAAACVMSLDDSCSTAACSTKVSYGASWVAAQNHPATYDIIKGHVFWDRDCVNSGSGSHATLSNGWTPSFNGNDACALSFEYTSCGGLYQNPVFDGSCPDPGVIFDGTEYVAVCTGGNNYPLRTSPDLTHWTSKGSAFDSAKKPSWATGDFWAPEIHKVGNKFVVYFSARQTNGRFAIGAAQAATALGPFTSGDAPLVTDDTYGLIDASEASDATTGKPYVIWKVDGNANGVPTPIFAQPLSDDGLTLAGSKTQLITNDKVWEGNVVEGPFMLHHGSYYYLFYSGNAYYNGTYAVGVARSAKLLGPYEKLPNPILTTNTAWVGPGHCSVLDLADGTTYMVYHSWKAGHVNGSGDARVLLVDQVFWGDDGWPSMPQAPSVHSRPMP